MARSLANRIDETLGEADWRDTWRRGLATHLAKSIGDEKKEKEEEEEEEEKQF